MASIDVVDSIKITAEPAAVFAVISDYANITEWLPIYRCTLRDASAIAPGVEVEHRYGYPPLILSRFTRRIDRIVPDSSIEESYIDGDMVGTGVWRFEKDGEGTLASYHCKVEANSLVTRLVFTLNGSNAHSNTYESLLKALKKRCEDA